MLLQVVKEHAECVCIDAVILDLICDDFPVHVYCCSYGNCFETSLLFWQENRTGLWRVPNRWLYLFGTEDCLVHIEDVLPPFKGFYKARKADHPTLKLVAQLASVELDFNSEYALLNFILQVQLSEAVYCNILGGKETIQVCSTFDQGLLVLLEERPGAR